MGAGGGSYKTARILGFVECCVEVFETAWLGPLVGCRRLYQICKKIAYHF